MVLEDDVELRRVLVELLQGEAFEVLLCDSHASLLNSLREDRSVVVLADFWGTSHHELSPGERDEIRELGRLAPTILLTGRAWATSADVADLDLICILPKPVDFEDVIERIRRCPTRAQDAEQ